MASSIWTWIEVPYPLTVRYGGQTVELRPQRLEALPDVQARRLVQKVPTVRVGDPAAPCERGHNRFRCVTCGVSHHGCYVCGCTHLVEAWRRKEA